MATNADVIRADKLRRNRQSAQKCRAKRKKSLDNLQQSVVTLSVENAKLLEDNMRLKAQLAELQAKFPHSAPLLTPLDDVFDFPPSKRIKCEEGATNSFDSSESAVFAYTLLMVILSGYVTTLLHCRSHATVTMSKACRANLAATVQMIVEAFRARATTSLTNRSSVKRTRLVKTTPCSAYPTRSICSLATCKRSDVRSAGDSCLILKPQPHCGSLRIVKQLRPHECIREASRAAAAA